MAMQQRCQDMINALKPFKPRMDEWESHAIHKNGKDDWGGFMESMEHSMKKGLELTPKRVQYLEKIANKYLKGPAGQPQQTEMIDYGDVKAFPQSDGFRIEIYGNIVGPAVASVEAKHIVPYLSKALPSLRTLFAPQAEKDF